MESRGGVTRARRDWRLSGCGRKRGWEQRVAVACLWGGPDACATHRVGPALVTRKVGIPVTNAFRTVLDLVDVVEDARANQLLDEALRKGLVSMEALWRFVGREKPHRRSGVGKLRRLLQQRDPGYQPSASPFQAGGQGE
jgi:hypothetical protein